MYLKNREPVLLIKIFLRKKIIKAFLFLCVTLETHPLEFQILGLHQQYTVCLTNVDIAFMEN